MPQPKQPATRKAPEKAAAKKASAAQPAAKKQSAAKQSAAKKAAAKPPAARPKRQNPAVASRPGAPPAPAPEPTSVAARDEALRANLAALRDLLAGGVVLTAQRLQDAVDEAVARGRITRRDAEDLAGGLVTSGRQQTVDLLADIEQLLGRGRSDLTSAGSATKATVKGSGDRVLREVDRARRVAGLGSSFPILGYDELTAAQVVKRLGELTPAELRKVRDHERRDAARSTVLEAVDAALG